MQASHIKVAHLVRIYSTYLARTRSASVETIAEFFFMVAGLLLEKTRSLLPDVSAETDTDDETPSLEDEEILETLARYRPYREAARWFWERREAELRRFRRIVEESKVSSAGELEYPIGDLYVLSRIWWGLFERYTQSRRQERSKLWEEADTGNWDGVPEALPEESQIQSRIEELEERLSQESILSLRLLCAAAGSVKFLVVTLLALLEMCRMGKISIEQETLFSDVKILAKN